MSSTSAIFPEPSFRAAEDRQKYWEQHYAELLERYPEQFVAMHDGQVIAASPDLVLLLDEVRDRGLDARTDVAIEFITAEPGNLLL